MNIIDFLNNNTIEGYKFNTLKNILSNNGEEKISSIIYDMIMLNNGKSIKCIKNYYYNNSDKKIGKSSKCTAIQDSYGLRGICRPFDCQRCHTLMLDRISNKKAILK